jgi:hypothetical protein
MAKWAVVWQKPERAMPGMGALTLLAAIEAADLAIDAQKECVSGRGAQLPIS